MVGVSEPGNLSSRPIMRCVMDEEAKYKHENKEEAHPVDLIEERAKGFHRYQILHASTPSSEEFYYHGHAEVLCAVPALRGNDAPGV